MSQGPGSAADAFGESSIGSPESPTGADPGQPPRGIPAIAEALGYIGGALALAAVIALIATFWSDLGVVGHVGVGVALAVAGLVGGFVLARNEGAAAQRLASFLLVAGVAGVGIAVGFAVRDALYASFPRGVRVGDAVSSAAEWGWFAGTAAIALSGGLVWWSRRRVLQHLAFGLGVAAAALLALPLIPFDGPEWGVGATLVAVALVWGALSLAGRLEPRVAGVVLAALGIAGGIEMMALMTQPTLVAALWLGALACAALIWLGSRVEELGVLGVGTVGLMVFSGQLVGEYLGFGAGTAIALIAIGFVVLGVGIRLTLRQAPETAPRRRVAAEVAGYLGIALAMGGAGVLLAQYWDELGTIGHVLIPLVGAVVAYFCALLYERSESGSARRLSQTLLAIGVLAAGITAAMVFQPIAETTFGEPGIDGDRASQWTMLAGAAAATLVGGVTWALRKGALTQIAFVAGISVSIITIIGFQGEDSAIPLWAFGSLFVVVGMVWVALGQAERITPVRTALAAGCYLTLQGLQMMTAGDVGINTWAALLGIGFGIAGIVLSIVFKRAILLGFGALAIVTFSMVIVMEEFGDQVGAPILLLVMGVVLIAVAVVAAKIAPRIRRKPAPA